MINRTAKSAAGRRRGTTIAAAALSMALVTPFVQPVVTPSLSAAALAQTADDAAAANDAATPAASQGVRVIEADAVANGRIGSATDATNAAQTLSGAALVANREGNPQSFASGNIPVPDGTVVYMQWMDTDGAVSPVYSTKTQSTVDVNGDNIRGGDFAFDLRYDIDGEIATDEGGKVIGRGWTDLKGKEHVYRATSGQYYRLWIQDYEDPNSGNTVTMLRQNGGFYPGSWVNSVTGSNLGQFPLIGANMQKVGVLLSEKPGDYMTRPESEWEEDEVGPLSGPAGLIGFTEADKESISGRVWLETGAGDYANSATGPNNNSKDPAAAGYRVVVSQLTPEGYSAYEAQVANLDKAEQAAAAKKLLTDHPEYIAYTRYAYTDAEGRYTVRVPEGSLGRLINTDRGFYMFVQDAEGKTVHTYNSWVNPVFGNTGHNTWAPQTAPAKGGHGNTYNKNFAVVPNTQVDLDILKYNTTDTPAFIGDTAEIALEGVTLSPLQNKIVWVVNGDLNNPIKTCDNLVSLNQAKDCTLELDQETYPLNDGDVVTAILYAGDNAVSSDSMIIKRYPEPKYAETETSKDGASSEEPTFEQKTAEKKRDGSIEVSTTAVELPENVEARFELGEGAPEGASVDPETGVVTLTNPKGKKDDIIDVPLKVTYTEKLVDANGKAINDPATGKQREITSTVDAVASFKLTEDGQSDADRYDPQPKDQTVKVGETPDARDNIVDFGELPEGTKAEYFEAPKTDEPGEQNVTVVVTYPDGSEDTVTAKVNVTEQPNWDDDSTTPGTEVKLPNTGGAVSGDETIEVSGPGTATLGEDGTITVT
ncbi:Rib/alpha-like domain-containing protein, partial [Corynebacterium lizhenjunii]|uniref:Rib/alpha-like domain-containing protein n=1 Tax=Corynebacterium lizhenjunii TaxID=2709394 RepID=UPI002E2C062F